MWGTEFASFDFNIDWTACTVVFSSPITIRRAGEGWSREMANSRKGIPNSSRRMPNSSRRTPNSSRGMLRFNSKQK